MKDIKNYILENIDNSKTSLLEAKDIHSKWKDVAKKLSKEDKEWIKKYAIDEKNNQIYTMEELEQRMWKGDLKDEWDLMNNYLIDHILTRDNGITQKDVIDTYSLARTGKQSMIEVIAQTLYMINKQLD